MKITESTSVSLKLLVPILGLAFGGGSWMFNLQEMIAKQGRDIRIIKAVVKKIAPAVVPNIVVPGLIGDDDDGDDEEGEYLGKL